MTPLREAAQQALEALTDFFNAYPHMTKGYTEDAITALKAALAEHDKARAWIDERKAQLEKDKEIIQRNASEESERIRKAQEEGRCWACGTALAESVQEPVGYFSINDYGRREENESEYGTPLYAAPPQRKPLTEKEILNILADVLQVGTFFDVARAIERAHGIG